MCRNFINSLLKVSNGIQFHRKKRGRIYDTESMTLGDQTFEFVHFLFLEAAIFGKIFEINKIFLFTLQLY